MNTKNQTKQPSKRDQSECVQHITKNVSKAPAFFLFKVGHKVLLTFVTHHQIGFDGQPVSLERH
jgi:hypothetical protein